MANWVGRAATLFGRHFFRAQLLTVAALSVSAASGNAAVCEVPHERTFIMIKPDGVNRALVGDIVKRFEQKGYTLVGIKMLQPPKSLAEEHYEEHKGRPFYEGLVDFLSSAPVVAMVWEGKGVVTTGRKLIGSTNPLESAPGTIRGDYGVTVGRNLVHGSDATESASREISLWFRPEELTSWRPTNAKWVYE